MTIKDIAKESGYAISTVSRALNNHPDVSEEAKKRIQEIVARNNFVPNTNARQLKRRQAKEIVTIVKGTGNLFFADMLIEIEQLASQAGFEILVRYQREEDNEVELAARFCRELKPQGILFLGGDSRNFIEGFANVTVPSVLATGCSEGFSFDNLSTVGVDDKAAAKSAMDHLLEQGHRQILILGGDTDNIGPSRLRLAGCKDSLSAHGIAFDPAFYCKAEYRIQSAFNAMTTFLNEGGHATAVFAMSDTMAVGAARAIADKGLKIPDDISVMGFDGTPYADYYIPRLATMRQPAQEIARASMKCLLKAIQSKKAAAQTLLMQAELEPGSSVKKL